MKKTIIYVHGKGGNKLEADRYKAIFSDSRVLGVDYDPAPQKAPKDINLFVRQSKNDGEVILIANSIGAYFSMIAGIDNEISKAYFISPIVDMEKIILNLMKAANVTEERLRKEKIIPTEFGEPLSFEYLSFVRNNPIRWRAPTAILYGENDAFTDFETMRNFAVSIGATITTMPNGEHWFHTPEQLEFLDNWIKSVQ
ncbi:MAG: alpha/beta hydrolase [Clostridia bacterium]|nr:alpha/beta hydrolase [Clostridia bacterium]